MFRFPLLTELVWFWSRNLKYVAPTSRNCDTILKICHLVFCGGCGVQCHRDRPYVVWRVNLAHK